jgi:hypothetical protein
MISTKTKRRCRAILWWVTILLWAGCSDGPTPAVPSEKKGRSTIFVDIATSGENIDADGYVLVFIIDGFELLIGRIAVDTFVSREGLAPDDYTVDLFEIAPNCDRHTSGNGSRIPAFIHVDPNDVAVVTFRLLCV